MEKKQKLKERIERTSDERLPEKNNRTTKKEMVRYLKTKHKNA